jgi:hypothetical protein
VARRELRVSWNQYWWQDWALDALVVVWIDADFFLLSTEWILAQLDGLKLVVGLKIRPAPDATVDDMRKAFAMRDLKSKSFVRFNREEKAEGSNLKTTIQ